MKAEKKMIVGNTLNAKKCSRISFAEDELRACIDTVEHRVEGFVNGVEHVLPRDVRRMKAAKQKLQSKPARRRSAD